MQPLRGVNRQVYDEFMATGAVVAGRKTFEPAGGWGGDHHDGVPIYILSRHPAPAWAADWPGPLRAATPRPRCATPSTPPATRT